jgi:hypothetical protein
MSNLYPVAPATLDQFAVNPDEVTPVAALATGAAGAGAVIVKSPGFRPKTVPSLDDSTLTRQAVEGLFGTVTESIPSLAVFVANEIG